MKHLINMINVANYTCTRLPYDGKGRGFKPRINLLIVLEDTFEILFSFRIFCWYRGFCHRTGSDLLLFLYLSF